MVVYIILNIIISLLIAQFGGEPRKIGFGGSLLISLLLSPVIGFIITILSPLKTNHQS